ncbi:keratin-3, type I cytoskeletal 51 kDa-like [Saccostrea cucullata]|uniref:keratin-3, type I cytoskeletal 51 kDa-like n=1 Tax=Saccostrea cuccullata TaxID=36930 RepID=UPI002ED3E1AB
MLRIISLACIVAYVVGDGNSFQYNNVPGYNDIGFGVQNSYGPYALQNNYDNGFNGGLSGNYVPHYFGFNYDFGGSAVAGAAASSDDFGSSAASSALAAGLGSAAAGAAASTGAAASAASAVGSGMFGNYQYYAPYTPSYPSYLYLPNTYGNRFGPGYGSFVGGSNSYKRPIRGFPRFHKRERSVY